MENHCLRALRAELGNELRKRLGSREDGPNPQSHCESLLQDRAQNGCGGARGGAGNAEKELLLTRCLEPGDGDHRVIYRNEETSRLVLRPRRGRAGRAEQRPDEVIATYEVLFPVDVSIARTRTTTTSSAHLNS